MVKTKNPNFLGGGWWGGGVASKHYVYIDTNPSLKSGVPQALRIVFLMIPGGYHDEIIKDINSFFHLCKALYGNWGLPGYHGENIQKIDSSFYPM
jgi:hypothetical protein